jgi:hypothetical protein
MELGATSTEDQETAVPISGNDREYFRLFAVRVLRTQPTTTRSFLRHCVDTWSSNAHYYDPHVAALR